MKKLSVYWKTLIIMGGVIIFAGLLGFLPGFCDWYTDHIYWVIRGPVSGITGIFPFAIGEILMYIGALALFCGIIFSILLFFLRKKDRYRRFTVCYLKVFLLVIVSTVLVYMINWYIPFRGTVFGRGEKELRTEYTSREMGLLLEYIAEGVNGAAEEIELAEDGRVCFPSDEEYYTGILAALQGISGEYPRLEGSYPKIKTALCSDILERMGIGGYTYPYTMEATHNKYLSPVYRPVLDAHELTHHKGYYKENEANFLSQYALSRSSDPYLRFAGYYEMYNYVYDAYQNCRYEQLKQMVDDGTLEASVLESEEAYHAALRRYFGEEITLSRRAWAIIKEGRRIKKEMYEQDHHLLDDLPAVDSLINSVSETGWSLQEEVCGDNYYQDVVLLLLQKYDGELY